MSDNNKDIYFSLNQNELNIAVFKKNDDKFIFFNKESLNIDTISENIDLETLKKPLGDNIIKIEKKLNSFVNNIFLMLESSSKLSVYISLMKKLDNKKIKQKDIIHIIQDAKQQIISAHPENYIAHIIVIKYVVNDVNYSSVPKNINCDTISIDIEFVCFPKNLITKIEILFKNFQIKVDKVICSNYARSIAKSGDEKNICQIGQNLSNGLNKQEVMLVPKKIEKKGFFEKLFHFFN